jgi:hypothetical protein
VTETADTATALRSILAELRRVAATAGRAPDSIRLVAVGKTQPANRLRPLLAAGHRLFGENRVQEAQGKWPALKGEWPGVELHLIGPLQTNKVREAVALFDVIETLDRPRLAAALAAEMAKSGRRPTCYVQVNVGCEAQKAGILPDAADAFIDECRSRFGLPVEGLMCIPPLDEDPTRYFTRLADMARRHTLAELSMGMSADWPAAVKAGATLVRLGTAIFGVRPLIG